MKPVSPALKGKSPKWHSTVPVSAIQQGRLNRHWGAVRRRGLSKYTFDNAWRQLAFDEHRRTIGDRFSQCNRLESALREAVIEWCFYPVIETLQAMRGIQFIAAVGLISELGDLIRFEHPWQLMSWFGITPSGY
jgi:transposase